MNLLKNVKVTQVLGYYAAAQNTVKGDIIDQAGWDGCMFIYEFGTIINGGTILANLKGDAANSTSAMAALLTTSAVTVNATTAAYGKSCIVVDVFQPDPVLHRYLEASIEIGTANAVVLGITAIQYNGRVHPDTQSASVLKSTQLVSPSE